MRGETPNPPFISKLIPFQSTPLMRGETPSSSLPVHHVAISIHSPHARGDRMASADHTGGYFNPLPSCEGRQKGHEEGHGRFSFQSTPLMRGETQAHRPSDSVKLFQSTPLMRGETKAQRPSDSVKLFQSTPLMRGETLHRVLNIFLHIISIHSPHARGDFPAVRVPAASRNFNPLPSCEGRPCKLADRISSGHFNPLPSCEGRPISTAI